MTDQIIDILNAICIFNSGKFNELKFNYLNDFVLKLKSGKLSEAECEDLIKNGTREQMAEFLILLRHCLGESAFTFMCTNINSGIMKNINKIQNNQN